MNDMQTAPEQVRNIKTHANRSSSEWMKRDSRLRLQRHEEDMTGR